MAWRDLLQHKLVSAAEAVSGIKAGDHVVAAPLGCTPFTLSRALRERRSQLRDVTIAYPSSLFPWMQDKEDRAFQLLSLYATLADREWINNGLIDYVPVGVWQTHVMPEGLPENPDAFLVPVSPPDRNGSCSFGSGVWWSRTFSQQARSVIAEVREDFIRTGGDNFIHVSQIDRFCQADPPPERLPLPERTQEEVLVTEVICTLVTSELVRDGDTLQVGIGSVSASLAMYLAGKHDLGIHSEVIPGGVAELVRNGVVTGKHKSMHPGKVVGAAFVAALPEEELRFIDSNPAFELYDFTYVDDLRVLIQLDRLVAINNAILVDVTGQVAAETIGPRVWSGVGGQTVFMIASQYSRGGRSVTVLPSSHLLGDQRVSRIVPVLPEGTAVTVPRTFVDYVVTEHGVATLQGKTIRERVNELITVAHPDFRSELRREARILYGV